MMVPAQMHNRRLFAELAGNPSYPSGFASANNDNLRLRENRHASTQVVRNEITDLRLFRYGPGCADHHLPAIGRVSGLRISECGPHQNARPKKP